jgi:hypothetical protein
MKQAPSKVTSVQQAYEALVLAKPFIYWDGYVYDYVPSASRSRNIRAINYCQRMNKKLHVLRKAREAEDAKT